MGDTGAGETVYVGGIQITVDQFGEYHSWDPCESCIDAADGLPILRYTLENRTGFRVQIMNLGATVTSISSPDKDGLVEDVLLGLEDSDAYRGDCGHFFGVTIGRYAGLISRARLKICDKKYCLVPNYNGHHRHGGCHGFDKAFWHSYIKKDKVVMTYSSCDEEEGYPGYAFIQVEFSITLDNALIMTATAKTSLPTPINIGHMLYFNLKGHGAGKDELRKHVIELNVDRIVDQEEGVPTGQLVAVGGTYYDFRVPRRIDQMIDLTEGMDSTFCLTKGLPRHSVTLAARLIHPESGRCMELKTDHVGFYMYTCNQFPTDEKSPTPPPINNQKGASFREPLGEFEEDSEGLITPPPGDESILSVEDVEDEDSIESGSISVTDDGGWGEGKESSEMIEILPGKDGVEYKKHCGIAFMATDYPNSVNHRNFPPSILFPGETYTRTVVYQFLVIPPPAVPTPEQFVHLLAEDEDFDIYEYV